MRIQPPSVGLFSKNICNDNDYNGNKYYVRSLYNTYNADGLKQRKQLQYMDLLQNRKNIGEFFFLFKIFYINK